MTLALSAYLRANISNKVIACFAETGQTGKIIPYSKKVGYSPDYFVLLQNVMRSNPDKGAEFVTQLVNGKARPLGDVELVHFTLAFTLILQAYAPHRSWISYFVHTPQVTGAILGSEMFTQ